MNNVELAITNIEREYVKRFFPRYAETANLLTGDLLHLLVKELMNKCPN